MMTPRPVPKVFLAVTLCIGMANAAGCASSAPADTEGSAGSRASGGGSPTGGRTTSGTGGHGTDEGGSGATGITTGTGGGSGLETGNGGATSPESDGASGNVDSGAPDTGGSADGGAAGNPSPGTVPAGYPAPTAANRSLCKEVPLQTSTGGGKFCPGGGPGPSCIECLFGGDTYTTAEPATSQGTMEAGNYAVTVTVGGSAAGQTQIDAETNRTLLAPVTTAAGASATYSFVVNVRAKEGQQQEDVAAGYPGLDLFFSGPATSPPQVSAIGYALVSAATKPVMIYVASDSTACDQTNQDYAGWGQMLPQFFAPPAGVANYADSGETSGSFLGNGELWGAVKNAMVAGDWVLIQFGHNDGTSTSSATFQANITKMVQDTVAKGAIPVLVSPPARATFSGGKLSDQSSLHAADMQAVAKKQTVAYIDLTSITSAWYTQLGSNGWQPYHALGKDQTHTNAAGADKIAGFVATAIRSQNIPLMKYLRN
jgi:lysophospholipase L1-like esterase